jgi:hypothetical protein
MYALVREGQLQQIEILMFSESKSKKRKNEAPY